MAEIDDRLAALESAALTSAKRLDMAEEFSSKLTDSLARAHAEIAVLSRALLFLGGTLEKNAKVLKPGVLGAVFDFAVSGLDDDMKAKAQRTISNLAMWKSS
jgi:hypothetical protein